MNHLIKQVLLNLEQCPDEWDLTESSIAGAFAVENKLRDYFVSYKGDLSMIIIRHGGKSVVYKNCKFGWMFSWRRRLLAAAIRIPDRHKSMILIRVKRRIVERREDLLYTNKKPEAFDELSELYKYIRDLESRKN
jgi:hypothetical protein